MLRDLDNEGRHSARRWRRTLVSTARLRAVRLELRQHVRFAASGLALDDDSAAVTARKSVGRAVQRGSLGRAAVRREAR